MARLRGGTHTPIGTNEIESALEEGGGGGGGEREQGVQGQDKERQGDTGRDRGILGGSRISISDFSQI